MPQDWGSIIDQEATAQGINPRLARGVARVESNFDPKAISPKGAIGIMQLMPDTAKMLNVNPEDPMDNIRGGIKYLKMLHDQFGGDEGKVLAAYNAGPGRANNPPAETQKYVQDVQAQTGPSWFTQNRPNKTNQPAWFTQNRPTKPGIPTPPPTLAEQGQMLAQGGPSRFVSGLGKSALTGGLIAGAGGLAAAMTPADLPVLGVAAPWLANMAASGLASAGTQKLETGEVDPLQTGFDVAMAGAAPLFEGAATRPFAKRAYGKAVAEEEARHAASVERFKNTAMSKDLEAQAHDAAADQFRQDIKFGSDRFKQPRVQDITEAGGRTQGDILARDAAARRALKTEFDQSFSDIMDAKVGEMPAEGTEDLRPTFRQLHTRQSKLGDIAAKAFKSKDYKQWKVASESKDKVLAKMEAHLNEIDPDRAKAFMDWRSRWADMEKQARQPAVQNLMKQAHDQVSEALLSPSKLAGKRQPGGTFGGGTTSPQEIFDSLRNVMSKDQYNEFLDATRDKLVQSAVNKEGVVDPFTLEKNIRKMGGNFGAFDPATQKEMLDAVQTLKDLHGKIGASEGAAKAARQEITIAKQGAASTPRQDIPEVPKLTNMGSLGKRITGALLGGGIGLDLLGAPQGWVSPYAKGAAALGVVSVLKESPQMARALLKSPEARRTLASLRGKGIESPLWDRLATFLIQGAGHSMERYATSDELPEPPR